MKTGNNRVVGESEFSARWQRSSWFSTGRCGTGSRGLSRGPNGIQRGSRRRLCRSHRRARHCSRHRLNHQCLILGQLQRQPCLGRDGSRPPRRLLTRCQEPCPVRYLYLLTKRHLARPRLTTGAQTRRSRQQPPRAQLPFRVAAVKMLVSRSLASPQSSCCSRRSGTSTSESACAA